MPTPGHPTHQDAIFHTQGSRRIVVRDGSGTGPVPPVLPGLITSDNGFWGDVPLLNYHLNPAYALLYDEPFVGYDTTNDWTATHATSGSEAISTTIPGALTLNPGATTAHQGTQIQRKTCALIPAANKSIWFEVKVLLGAGLTTEFFAGLAEVNTTVIASGALNTINNIGWSSVTGDGVLLFGAGKASTQSTGIAAVTLSITVPHTLGFFYDGVADTVQQYIDGVATGAAIATTNIPKVVVYPSFVGQVTGTTQTTVTLSALRILQLR